MTVADDIKVSPMRYYLHVLLCAQLSLAAVFILPFSGYAGETTHTGKPMSPLQVSITPVQSTFVPANIQPGDTVEFKITGRTFTDTDKLDLKVELHGLELVSGATSWSGSAKKGEDIIQSITVRVPNPGKGGLLRARIAIPPSNGALFSAETEYRLGSSVAKKPATQPRAKKDGKGRAVREYGSQ